MGVPGLFSFLNRRYPQITQPVEHQHGSSNRCKEQTDNLYVDMNHIVHSCTHALVAKDRPEVSQAEMFAGMGRYLDNLLDLLEPRRVVLIAVDGVAPRAKMNQQRTRRFLSAYISSITERTERDIRREMSGEAGGNLHIPDLKPFDPNIITPGTEFMLALAQWLREWAEERVSRDRRFAHTTFIISDASEPGEGEHKIMKFMRHLRIQPGYDPNTQHVVFGQDADLLLLTLLSHEPHVRIIREDMQANKPEARAARKAGLQQQDHHQQQQQRNPILQQQQLLLQQHPLSAVQAALIQQQQQGSAPSLPGSSTSKPSDRPPTSSSDHLNMPLFELVDISLLRECLQWEFSDLVGPPGSYGSDLSSTDSDTDIDDTENIASNISNVSTNNTIGINGNLSAVQNGSDSRDNSAGNGSSSSDKVREDATVSCGAMAPVADAAAVSAGCHGRYPVDAAAAVPASGGAARDIAVAAAAANGVAEPTRSTTLAHVAARRTTEPAAEAVLTLQAKIQASQEFGDDSDSLEDLLSVLNSSDSAIQSESAQPPAAAATDAVRPSSRNSGSASSSSSSRTVDQAGSGTPRASDPVATSAAASQTTGDATAHSDAAAAGPAAIRLLDSTLCLPAAAAASASAAGSALAQGSAAGPAVASGIRVSSNSSNLALQGSLEAPGAAPSAGCSQAGSRSKAVLDGMGCNASVNNRDPSVSVTAIARNAKQFGDVGSTVTATATRCTPPVAVGVRGGTRAARHRGKAGLSFENLLDDIVVLTFLVGNDFLPHIPSLDIYDRPTGLDLLFTAYKQLLPSLGGHVTGGGTINRSRLVQLLVYLQRDEEAAYKRRADYRRRRSCQRFTQRAAVQAEVHALFDGGLSMGEVPAGVNMDQLLMGVSTAAAEEQQYWSDIAAVNLWNMSPGQLCEELSNRVSARVNDRVMGGDPWAQDPIQMDMPKYRDRYYQARFPELYQQLQGDVDKVAGKVSWEYLQGMQWVLRYYTAGPAAIRWQKKQQLDPELHHHMRSSRVIACQWQDIRCLGAARESPSSDAALSDDSMIPSVPCPPEGNGDPVNHHQQQQQQQVAEAGSSPECNGVSTSNHNHHDHQQQQQRVSKVHKKQQLIVNADLGTASLFGRTKKSSSSRTSSAADLDGASWTWCYPYHYAPLMQDLAKVKLWGKAPRGKAAVMAGPVHLKRQLANPDSCPISDWAPIGGPVRPLLQLMCVLPAKSAADALPGELANVIAIAETMEDGTAIAANNPQQQQKYRHNRPSRGVANRQSDHNPIPSETAPRPRGEVSTSSQRSRFHEVAESASDTEADANTDCNNNSSALLLSNHTGGENPREPSSAVSAATGQASLDSDNNSSSSSSSDTEQQGNSISFSHVLGFDLTGDSNQDLIRLAGLLCTTFPSNIDSLVDLTGKKYIHTGVVRLPMADPQIIAAVLQAVLSMQQHDSSSSSSRRGLSESELQGNSFRPAAVIAATANDGPDSSSSSNGSSSDGSLDVWQSLARTVASVDSGTTDGGSKQRQLSLSLGASSSSSSRSSTTAVPLTAAAAASKLGALGMLLGQRGALHTLPKTTLQHLPTVSSHQQQQGVPVKQQTLDIAGLAVPKHHCCLLSGVDLQDLKVTPAVWRHMAAGFTSATHHAERVLGIRSSSTYNTSNSVGSAGSADFSSGRGVLGRGSRGRRGRWGRSYWGDIAM